MNPFEYINIYLYNTIGLRWIISKFEIYKYYGIIVLFQEHPALPRKYIPDPW